MNTNTNVKLHAIGHFKIFQGNGFQSLAHFVGSGNGTACIIFITHRRTKQSHNGISNKLIYGTAVLFNYGTHNGKVAVQKGHNCFRLVKLTYACKRADIAEQNCNISFFANTYLVGLFGSFYKLINNLRRNKTAECLADISFKLNFLFEVDCLVNNFCHEFNTEIKQIQLVCCKGSFAHNINNTNSSSVRTLDFYTLESRKRNLAHVIFFQRQGRCKFSRSYHTYICIRNLFIKVCNTNL